MGTAAVAVPILHLKGGAVFIESGNVARLQEFALIGGVSAILDEVYGLLEGAPFEYGSYITLSFGELRLGAFAKAVNNIIV